MIGKSFFGGLLASSFAIWLPIQALGDIQYPCGIGWSSAKIPCGPDRDAEPGECFAVVGSQSCVTTTTHECSDTDDYWCRNDDECYDWSNDEDLFCDTANYSSTTALWYFECLDDSIEGCGCVRATDIEDTVPITYQAFVAGTDACAL